jgi:hypothetical protein
MKPLKLEVLEHSADHYEFRLVDCEIYYVNVINFAFCEITTKDRELLLHVGGEGVLIADGATHNVNGEVAGSLVPLRRLVGTYCQRLEAFESGWLEAEFSDGSILKLPPDELYENWEMHLWVAEHRNWQVGASPGGGIWVFGP